MAVTVDVVAAVMVAAAVSLARGPDPAFRARRVNRSVAGSDEPPGIRLALGSRRRRGDTSVRELVESWASELRSGAAVGTALARAFLDVPSAAAALPRARAAAECGGDVARALRVDAQGCAAPAERRAVLAAAACWDVARVDGGRLAEALDRVADGMRSDALHLAHVRAELAGPRATARLLAALPVFALLLASGLGFDPIGALLGTPYGRAALAAGIALDVLGLAWTRRMARAAERAA
jgi:tight adherence protein B